MTHIENFKERLYLEVLPFVAHPTRYIGSEQNAVYKIHDAALVKVLLAFPETYEVGMSYLGFKILYGIINERTDALAERVFSPWPDLEAKLKEKDFPLYSLESFTPASEFDILAFTLQYEMTYTNILQILDLSGIPFLASERGEEFPLVIGGGPSAFNPEPITDFFDIFLVGEGEEAINDIIDTVKSGKASGLKKKALLEELAKIKGVYVSSFYKTEYNEDKTIKKIERANQKAPEVIQKRIVVDMDKSYQPVAPVVPYMDIIQNRISLEIMRGCTRGCRFCVSGITTRPLRERSVSGLLNAYMESYKNTGFDELSLSSLSSTDHSRIKEMLRVLNKSFEGESVSVSLPSSRIDAFSVELAAGLNSVRKSTLTFAPEAGTQRLRNVINKCVTEEDLLTACTSGVKSGMNNIKLYFMLGLPTETDEDVIAIGDLSRKVNAACKSISRNFRGLTVSISFFIPKPHTPFMWQAQDTTAELKKKIDLLRKSVNPRWLKWHSLELSALEGVFSRGDRKLGLAIKAAYEKGARFDAWHEMFKQTAWDEAFKTTGIDPEFYSSRKRGLDEVLPWDHISSGVTKEFLKKEYEKSLKGETTGNCRTEGCVSCGIGDDCNKEQKTEEISVAGGSTSGRFKKFAVAKYSVTYEKSETIKFVSHLELLNAVLRTLVRSRMPLAQTEGFNPHPKVAFSPALPVGVSSNCEVFEFELTKNIPEAEALLLLKAKLPPGLVIKSLVKADLGLSKLYSKAVYEIQLKGVTEVQRNLLPETVERLDIENGLITLTVNLKAKGTTSVFKLLAQVTGLDAEVVKGAIVKRKGLL